MQIAIRIFFEQIETSDSYHIKKFTRRKKIISKSQNFSLLKLTYGIFKLPTVLWWP